MRPIPTWFHGLAKAAIAAIAIYLAYRLASLNFRIPPIQRS